MSDHVYLDTSSVPHVPLSAHPDIPSRTPSHRCSFEFAPPVWTHISPAVKDLIRHMLDVNPQRRFTVNQCLQHPWFTRAEGVLPALLPANALSSAGPRLPSLH
jgi:serine/threonine protein kinase